MLTFKKILWPTDFSSSSYEALKTAKELALHFSSEMYIVHVIRPLPPFVEPQPGRPRFNVSLYLNGLMSSAKKSLQEVIEKKIEKKLKAHAIVAYGNVAEEISRIAERKNVQLIVIATHGTTSGQRFLLGSVTEKVLRIASTSVLTVRAHHKEK